MFARKDIRNPWRVQLRISLAGIIAGCVASSASADVDQARVQGLKYLVQTQQGDGSFSGLQGLDVQATAAAIEAMLAGGLNKSPQYGRALAWLANTSADSIDARSWQVAALVAAGRDVNNIAGGIRDERNVSIIYGGSVTTGFAVWGPFPDSGSSLPDTVLAYGALRGASVTYSNDTSERLVTALCYILPAQLTAAPWAGSWPHAAGQAGQPGHIARASLISTALTLYELKKQRQAGRYPSGSTCGKTSPGVIDIAMANAKTWLIAQANSDGGFAERSPQTNALEPSSPLASALAIRALALFAAEGDSASTTAVASARIWLATQQDSDGSWRGDPFVTARVLAALPTAIGAQVADADNDGMPNVIEQALGTQTSIADAQSTLPTAAAAQPGTTAASFSASGFVGQPFAQTIGVSGGTAPFSFVRTAGTLPPGLSLAADGLISGTPTNAGSYAFDYELTDAAGATALVIGRIDIAQAVASASEGDVPIPAWALIALGGALCSAIRRKVR